MDPKVLNGWTKHLTNGQSINSYEGHEVSWRDTNLTDIESVTVSMLVGTQLLTGCISGPGTYWQSSDYLARVVPNSTILGKQCLLRIERQIVDTDIGFLLLENTKNTHGLITRDLTIAFPNVELNDSQFVKIDPTNIGSWIVIELSKTDASIKWYISKVRI
jgi:hypothetical protein